MISILGDRAANVDITWYHWQYNIDITKNRFYMAARIDKIVISELAATDPLLAFVAMVRRYLVLSYPQLLPQSMPARIIRDRRRLQHWCTLSAEHTISECHASLLVKYRNISPSVQRMPKTLPHWNQP